MSLPDDIEIKSYLRISTDVEDDLIFSLNLSARAWVTSYLGVPLESEPRTFKGRYPREGIRREAATQLVIPVVPCSTTATITDFDDVEVDSTTYTIDERTGFVDTVPFEVFDSAPYQIVVNVGWQHHPSYDDNIDPILRQAILDLASDMWNRRNPGAEYEQSGGQVSITYTRADMPLRTKSLLETLRPSLRAW